MKSVYLDNAATTAMSNEALKATLNVMEHHFGNPSSMHAFGRSSKALLEQSRKAIANHLNVSSKEIIFTSGGTEADNLVIKRAVKDLGVTHIITSKIEHHAVLHTVEQLRSEYDVQVSYVQLDTYGSVKLEQLEELLLSTDKKTLVSLMHVNNEIGNILDVKKVGDLCKANNALFHTDAVQSVGHLKLDLQDVNIDFLAASAHKFHGPKGVGFAFIRHELTINSLISGGSQERGVRAGTEGLHNIVGMEVALNQAYDNLIDDTAYIANLKQYFIESITSNISGVTFNGLCSNLDKSTYTLVSVCLPVSQENASMLLFQLDLKGIACSKGSACQSGSSKGSHVLQEILSDEDLKKPSIRFSFSKSNTKEEIDYVIGVLKEFIVQ